MFLSIFGMKVYLFILCWSACVCTSVYFSSESNVSVCVFVFEYVVWECMFLCVPVCFCMCV